MGKRAKLERQRRQQELLKLFVGDWYQEKQVGDKWYVKMWNGGTNKWQVGEFTAASFKKYKQFRPEFLPNLREIAQEDINTNSLFRDELNDKLKGMGL
jgi:hypothetical protein